MAKVTVQFTCAECGTTSGRWLGKCPGCGAFGSLVEELHGSATSSSSASPSKPIAIGAVPSEEAARIPTGVSELDRVLGGGLVPASLVLVGRGARGREVHAPAHRARRDRAEREASAARDRRGVGCSGVAPGGASRRCRGGRDPRGDGARHGVRHARGGAAGRLRHRLGADAARLGARLRAGIGRPGARGRGTTAARREGGRSRHGARRPRDEGRGGRGPARARAPRRLRPPVRGRPLPRASRAARDEEPLRLDERARRLRDDGGRPRGRAGSVGALRDDASGRGRRCRRVRARGDAAAPARDPGAGRAHRSRDAAARRQPGSTRSGSR